MMSLVIRAWRRASNILIVSMPLDTGVIFVSGIVFHIHILIVYQCSQRDVTPVLTVFGIVSRKVCLCSPYFSVLIDADNKHRPFGFVCRYFHSEVSKKHKVTELLMNF